MSCITFGIMHCISNCLHNKSGSLPLSSDSVLRSHQLLYTKVYLGIVYIFMVRQYRGPSSFLDDLDEQADPRVVSDELRVLFILLIWCNLSQFVFVVIKIGLLDLLLCPPPKRHDDW